ncbi:histidine kinase [Sphingomonas montanisoli]|uniref:Histidine kinase n=1 Tax=Sphingomonas montanisoli TaxID=2606412 RepID=A0A5D9C3K4_9SPHN|nr:histidine kinase [Sphingomonas montanisoli]TZG26043.1 histidine kinase [Sphingomonas montanisoli]
MWKFLGGAVAAMLVMGGGLLIWQGMGDRPRIAASAPSASAANAAEPLTTPPAADEATKEERRFNRYDKDRDGKVSTDEYLASRHKAYAKLDTNGDGRLSFEEWAIRTTTKFATADADKTGTLDATEFATTKVLRKTRAPAPCKPADADD